jgi:hypothetical protein
MAWPRAEPSELCNGLNAQNLTGCGKTILACENFDGPLVWYNSRTLPQEAQKGCPARLQ